MSAYTQIFFLALFTVPVVWIFLKFFWPEDGSSTKIDSRDYRD